MPKVVGPPSISEFAIHLLFIDQYEVSNQISIDSSSPSFEARQEIISGTDTKDHGTAMSQTGICWKALIDQIRMIIAMK